MSASTRMTDIYLPQFGKIILCKLAASILLDYYHKYGLNLTLTIGLILAKVIKVVILSAHQNQMLTAYTLSLIHI